MGLRFHDRASPEATACSRTVPGDAPEMPGSAASPASRRASSPARSGRRRPRTARPPAFGFAPPDFPRLFGANGRVSPLRAFQIMFCIIT